LLRGPIYRRVPHALALNMPAGAGDAQGGRKKRKAGVPADETPTQRKARRIEEAKALADKLAPAHLKRLVNRRVGRIEDIVRHCVARCACSSRRCVPWQSRSRAPVLLSAVAPRADERVAWFAAE
jgi:hypothetical protein